LLGTFEGPLSNTFGGAASVSRFESVRHVELLKGHFTKSKLCDASKHDDGNGD
jgi:hypothetical protein